MPSSPQAVRELPVLFNGEMVRAILRAIDPKTQSRRPEKRVPAGYEFTGTIVFDLGYPASRGRAWAEFRHPLDRSPIYFDCPLGAPGDLLYVRETWAPCDYHADDVIREEPTCVRYRADDAAYRHEGEAIRLDTTGWGPCGGWRPSIHMPKWAARIWLRVTDARVERIDSISMADVNAEGFEACEEFEGCFRQTWDAIYGPQGFGWDANPWVWAVTFERVEAPR